MKDEILCPLCRRPLGKVNISRHHLLPKSEGGSHEETVMLHNICHQKIHSLFTEKELKDHFHTIERLRGQKAIRKFVRWVSKKDPAYYERNEKTNRRKFQEPLD